MATKARTTADMCAIIAAPPFLVAFHVKVSLQTQSAGVHLGDHLMVYLRSGTVVQQPTFFEEVLALPIRLYHFIVFFFMTLIDVRAAPRFA